MNPDWPIPSTFPRLEKGEVHLWKVDLTTNHPIHLSSDEQERADRFKIEKPRQQFTQARSALRTLLASHLGTEPAKIEFDYAEHGKPTLQHPETSLHFNVSHSQDYALIAIANGIPIGVDIEWLERKADIEALANRFYSKAEQTELKQLPIDLRHQAFLNLWTQKEAYLKALGSGLSRDTRSFAVTLEGGLATDDREPAAPSSWSIHPLIPAPDYCAAIAAPSTHSTLCQFTHTIDLIRRG